MTTPDTVPDEGAHTLRYRSTRAEVWRFYWRAWRKSLWVSHVLAAAALAWCLSDKTWPSVLLWFAACLPAVTACLAAVPQIMFKPHERTLELTPEGWSTTIGTQAGSMPWRAIRTSRRHLTAC